MTTTPAHRAEIDSRNMYVARVEAEAAAAKVAATHQSFHAANWTVRYGDDTCPTCAAQR